MQDGDIFRLPDNTFVRTQVEGAGQDVIFYQTADNEPKGKRETWQLRMSAEQFLDMADFVGFALFDGLEPKVGLPGRSGGPLPAAPEPEVPEPVIGIQPEFLGVDPAKPGADEGVVWGEKNTVRFVKPGIIGHVADITIIDDHIPLPTPPTDPLSDEVEDMGDA